MWTELLQLHAALHPSYQLRGVPYAALTEAFESELRDPRAAVWVAESEEPQAAPVGFCIARSTPAPEPAWEGSRGSLDELWVAPEERRRGVGRDLVRAVLHVLRSAGVDRVEVRVLAANPEARAFWGALGFGPFADILERPL